MRDVVCAWVSLVEDDSCAFEKSVVELFGDSTGNAHRAALSATGRHPGLYRGSSVRAGEQRRPRRLRRRVAAPRRPDSEPATQGARDRIPRASVQPCTRSGHRHGFGSDGFGRRSEPLAPRKGRPLTRATAGGQDHASPGGCARVSRRLQKSTSGVRRSILDAVAAVPGKGRLARRRITPPAGERRRAPRSDVRCGRSRALVVGGRYSSSVSPLVAGHAVSFGGRRGALAEGLSPKGWPAAGNPGAPETRWARTSPEEKAGAVSDRAGRSG
jgi:hypothetical protein